MLNFRSFCQENLAGGFFSQEILTVCGKTYLIMYLTGYLLMGFGEGRVV
jgi:hypothetical protein